MIDIIFRFGPDYVLVKIEGSSIRFGYTTQGAQLANIEGLKLDQTGVEAEFPDLKGDPEWRLKAIIRFNNKIKELKTEMERVEYIIKDLKKHGYVPIKMQESGKREVKL